MIRVGYGYDVHQLVAGRELILGGVTVPFERGLLGHSDADVLCHAIGDALLGAAALGDLGSHFPDTDAQFAGISSLLLLQEIRAKLVAAGYRINNVDSMIICETPKLAAFVSEMRQNIATALALAPDQISVKATTSEKMGFAGRGEGMAAHATVLIENGNGEDESSQS